MLNTRQTLAELKTVNVYTIADNAIFVIVYYEFLILSRNFLILLYNLIGFLVAKSSLLATEEESLLTLLV